LEDAMGFEQLDMIIRTENNFGIAFDDAELIKISTVGEFYQLILSKLSPGNSTICLTSHTFYRIRKVLMDVFGLPRHSIKPIVRLENIIPKAFIYLHWKNLEIKLGLKLPTLQRPQWMETLFSVSVLLVILLAIVLGIGRFVHPLIAWAVGFMSFPLLVLENRLTQEWQIIFPKHINDLGKLVKIVLQRNFSTINKDIKSCNKKEILELLILQLEDQFGIPADKIKMDSRIAEDLGISD
jgi:acyl carrier protein